MDDAHELLAKRRFKKAWKVGRRLNSIRYSGAYEIRARAFEGLGRSATALAVLKRGVRRAPHAAMLWSLLGEALSDVGRFDEALGAFATGEAIEGNLAQAVYRGNRAMVLVRSGRLDEAAAVLDFAPEGETGGDDPSTVAFLELVRADIEDARRLP
jgi:Flp pilus assembly protein TadD